MNESEVFDKMIKLLTREAGGIKDDFFKSRLPFLGWVLAAITFGGSLNGSGAARVVVSVVYLLIFCTILGWYLNNAYKIRKFYSIIVPLLACLIDDVQASAMANGTPVVPSVEDLKRKLEEVKYFSEESLLVVACSVRVCLLSYRP
jgi:hypothetical protein